MVIHSWHSFNFSSVIGLRNIYLVFVQ